VLDEVRAIAERLVAAKPQFATLARGEAGLALLFAYLHRALPREGYGRHAEARLTAALAGLDGDALSYGLYAGFSGIAWLIAHLDRERLLPDASFDLDDIDAALLERLAAGPFADAFDLVYGLGGVAVYACESAGAAATPLLSRVVAQLGALAEPCGDGAAFRTAARWLDADSAARFPAGCFELGVAHGTPGTFAPLSRAAELGVSGARMLRDAVVRWVWSRRQPAHAETSFVSDVTPEQLAGAPAPLGESRSAWCNGDPGIALALAVATRGGGDPAWRDGALAVARHAAVRPRARTGVVDATLCHGAAGLLHVFNRLYHDYGDPLLAAAARAWLDETLAYCQAGAHATMTPDFIDGLAGVALALLAAASDVAPSWDRLLAISV
jgi:hypothetical protein